jgi:hypothetical protein
MSNAANRKKEIQENCMCVEFSAYRLVRIDSLGLGWRVGSKEQKSWALVVQYAHRLGSALKMMLKWAENGGSLAVGKTIKGGENVKTDEVYKMTLTADEQNQVRIMMQWVDYWHELIKCGVAKQGDVGVLEYGGYTVKRNDVNNLKATGILYGSDAGWFGDWQQAAHDVLEKVMTGKHTTLYEAFVAGGQYMVHISHFFNFDLNRKQDADGKKLKRPPTLPTPGRSS